METLEIEQPEDTPGLMIVSLNRPEKLNPFNAQMYQELQQVCHNLHENGGVRVVMLTGTGRAFSSGAEIRRPGSPESEGASTPSPPEPFAQRLRGGLANRVCDLVEGLDQVTIAAVNGLAVGGAVPFLAAADMRVAAESAWFSLPEINMGAPLALGSLPRLVRAMGTARTLELVLMGDRFSSRDALSWGLVNHVYPDDEFQARSRELAAAIAAKPPLALALLKSSVRAIGQVTTPPAMSFADRDLLSLASLSRRSQQNETHDS